VDDVDWLTPRSISFHSPNLKTC